MIALYILLGLVVLIALILSLNVEISYRLKGKIFSLWLRVGPVKIKLLPSKKKRINYKKLAKKLRGRKISEIKFARKKKKQSGKELDIKELFSDLRLDKMIDEISKSAKNPELVKIILMSVKEFALKFKTKLHTTVDHLVIKVDEKDAAKTCIRVGIITQAVSYLLEFLDCFTNMKALKENSVAVIPSFDDSGYEFYIDGKFRLRIGTLLTSFISAAFKSAAAASNENNTSVIRKDIKK
mgnify:CR=1 FL=1